MRKVIAFVSLAGLVLTGCAAEEPEAVVEEQPAAAVEEPMPPPEPEPVAPDWSQPASLSDVQLCKVLDGQSPAAREAFEGYSINGKRSRGNIGFPLSPHTLPVSGESNMIAVMLVFVDAPPRDQTPRGYLRPQLDLMEEWADYWSQGKLDLNFQLVDE